MKVLVTFINWQQPPPANAASHAAKSIIQIAKSLVDLEEQMTHLEEV